MTELDRKVEIDILVAQSDFIPRNQNAISTAIGRQHIKSTNRVKIHRAIRRLSRFFERSTPGIDDNGKIWVMKKDIDNIRDIAISYPELLPHLQSNEIVLSMLVDKHVNKICTDEWLTREQELEFKKRIMVSATFFRMYLLEEVDKLKYIFETLFSITRRGVEFERQNQGRTGDRTAMPADYIRKYGFVPLKPSFDDLLDVTFRTCVGADILYGRGCGAGIEFIKNMKLPSCSELHLQ